MQVVGHTLSVQPARIAPARLQVLVASCQHVEQQAGSGCSMPCTAWTAARRIGRGPNLLHVVARTISQRKRGSPMSPAGWQVPWCRRRPVWILATGPRTKRPFCTFTCSSKLPQMMGCWFGAKLAVNALCRHYAFRCMWRSPSSRQYHKMGAQQVRDQRWQAVQSAQAGHLWICLRGRLQARRLSHSMH